MLNPEYYLGAYQLPDGSWRTTQFSDEPPADLEAARETRVWERRPLYCSRPGPAGGWAEARWTGVPPEPQTPGERAACAGAASGPGAGRAPKALNTCGPALGTVHTRDVPRARPAFLDGATHRARVRH